MQASRSHEREKSLRYARMACEWITEYLALPVNEPLAEQLTCLLAEFERLDAKEQKQIKAGKRYGKLGAEHGKKGGRPRKDAK